MRQVYLKFLFFIFLFLPIITNAQPGAGGSLPGRNPGGGQGDPCSGLHPPPGCSKTVPIQGEFIIMIVAIAMGLYFTGMKPKLNRS